MTIQFFNKFYFLYIFIAILLIIMLYEILKNKSYKVKYNTLLFIAFGSLLLHFMKLFFDPYNKDFPYSIRHISFENICAVSTLVLPWIMLYKKNKVLNNYIAFISFIGGLGAFLVPTEALGRNPFIFDVIRFYVCHFVLLCVPLLSMLLKVFKPDYRHALITPLMFLLFELVILINELIIMKIGLVNCTLEDFLSQSYRNSSLIFGPLPAMDSFDDVILIFVPKVFTQNIFGIAGVGDFYWPIIWMIIPCFIYFPIGFLLFSIPTNYKDMVNDFRKFRQRKIVNKVD